MPVASPDNLANSERSMISQLVDYTWLVQHVSRPARNMQPGLSLIASIGLPSVLALKAFGRFSLFVCLFVCLWTVCYVSLQNNKNKITPPHMQHGKESINLSGESPDCISPRGLLTTISNVTVPTHKQKC